MPAEARDVGGTPLPADCDGRWGHAPAGRVRGSLGGMPTPADGGGRRGQCICRPSARRRRHAGCRLVRGTEASPMLPMKGWLKALHAGRWRGTSGHAPLRRDVGGNAHVGLVRGRRGACPCRPSARDVGARICRPSARDVGGTPMPPSARDVGGMPLPSGRWRGRLTCRFPLMRWPCIGPVISNRDKPTCLAFH
ncbi:hypothetical protein HAX54_028104 [Datura stramonium]|uniref:Uncharacterized protein n=1 Tax=Datura stramonium TaxID=4076 RepID=A0ABS8Y817_DATST|nr:hypothetical protein [Datura stramonium]